MSDLSNYTNLCATAADWLNRQDLAAQIPVFVTMFEARLNRVLRVRNMQAMASASSLGAYVPVPGDFLAPYSLELAISPGIYGRPIEFISEKDATVKRALGVAPPTRWYTIFGSNFEIVPAPATPPAPATGVPYVLKYYQRIPALAAATGGVNWLLQDSPDLYLYGTLLGSAPYLKNDDRATVWEQFVENTIGEMNIASERALKPQSSLAMSRKSFG